MWEVKKYEDFEPKQQKIIDDARKDFEERLANSSERQKKNFMNGCMIWCMHWARGFADPQKKYTAPLYKHIYKIMSDWCEDYQKGLNNKPSSK